MHISINTAEEISDLDRQILGLLIGEVAVSVEAPAEKPAAKKAAAKKPDPEPEPLAEEPLPDDEEEPEEEEADEEEEEEDGVDEDMSDEDLLALAVKKATAMVADGQAAQVREALDAAGAARVRELNSENVREFFKALS